MTKNSLLLLIDGSSYLYRAFHAMHDADLKNARGEPTGAVYGVINMVRKLLEEVSPQYVAVVFDAKGKTFRDDLFAAYKAQRPSMPDDLSEQIAPLHAIIHALGLPLLMVDDVEADDVIATLAVQATAEGIPTLIASSDKDLAQLVDGHVTLVNTMSNQRLDRAGVIAKFGVPPERIIDYLALVGDTSDNVPGVPKAGPVTAVKWLTQYGTLDNLVAHADEVGGKVGESLRASLAQLPLARALLTLKQDVPLPHGPRDLVRRAPDVAALREWYARLEFKTWLERLTPAKNDAPPPVAAPTPAPPSIFLQAAVLLESAALVHDWLGALASGVPLALAVETTGTDYMQATLTGLALHAGTETAYVPHALLEALRPTLEDARIPKLGHDLKFSMNVLARHGIALAGLRFDVMLESYVLNSVATHHDLPALAGHYLSETMTPPDAAACVQMSVRLHATLAPQLQRTGGVQKLYDDIELPLVPVLSRIERTGVRVDAALLHKQSAELGARLGELEQAAHASAGQPFNLGSPLQIQDILYGKLNLPVLKKTPKGQPSTAEDVLQELALDYPLPRLILEHRALSKLKSTYTDRLPEQIDPATGRVHTSYHQAVTATGRLSSSDPNLQNIPIRTEEGRRIRQAFVAPPGYKILAADYSQIELRIMAHLSGDAGLLRAFTGAQDIHKITAAEVMGIPLEQVSAEQRRAAKAINFGLIYGMSAFGLARQLGVDRAAAQEYIERYFARYPGVKTFMDTTRAQAHTDGFVETLFGRRLYLPEINARNMNRRQYAERTAINAPMQGSAADIIKLAMLRIDAWLAAGGTDARMVMQVHDELVFEVAEGVVDTAAETIRTHMTEVMRLSVPLVVDVGTGANWDEAH
ncbi:MAG: DNA polymerase I [Proteobacteria bacterium]|nr:DNA polymerase I [Pseudomonadota bacterium]